MGMRLRKRNVAKATVSFILFLVFVRFGSLWFESETTRPDIHKAHDELDLKIDNEILGIVKHGAFANPDERVINRNLAIKENHADYVKHEQVNDEVNKKDEARHEQPVVKKEAREKLLLNNDAAKKLLPVFGGSKYALDISVSRMNRLLDILYEKEQVYSEILDELQVASFQRLVDNKAETDKALAPFAEERNKFLLVEDGKVHATEKFLEYLQERSDYHTFESPRENVVKAKVHKNKPVIITAANSGYYLPLQATVASVHESFPDYHLIVYDLGLDPNQHDMTKANCKCEVIKFDLTGVYKTKSPHVADLKTYAWKPILIQETLRKHETVIYIDSSIRFHSNELQPLVNTLRDVGLLTQYIGLKLNCYTNPKQFEWFGETAKSYQDFYTIEANILFFHRNFITTLMMKAWVTCALDVNCIAPPGSSIGGCCGCHRYDQDALTVVSSFFYAHPKDNGKLPAYSFTKGESFFFQVRRYEGRDYFTKPK